ncbi:acetyl-CoA carboxylase ACC1, partial [Cardiosporidium cionae]
MERAAQRLTSSIGYQSAGTVEFLYNLDNNKYYFLELNPRLQVEHPVTEGNTGINLPATQFQVAMGIPLHRIPDIRRFWGASPEGVDSIDFNKPHIPITNHIMAARITAENPDEGFKPTSGSIERVEYQFAPKVWGYFSVGANGAIHEYADSQFGHIFAEGKTREEARKALMLALKRVDVRGEIRTTVEYLSQLLETRDFTANTINTGWLDGIIKQQSVDVPIQKDEVIVAAALFRSLQALKEREKKILNSLQRGQLFVREVQELNSLQQVIFYDNQKYSFSVERTGRDVYVLQMNDQSIEARCREQPDGSVMATFGGKSHKFNGREEVMGLRMSVDGVTVFLPSSSDPSELPSDINGKLIRYLVKDGGTVARGEPFAEVEAMKMIMTLKAGASGKITHLKSPGSIVAAGELLASLQLKDAQFVKKVETFTGKLDIEDIPVRLGDYDAATRLELIMQGFNHPVDINLQKVLASPVGENRDSIGEFVERLLRQFLEVESLFAGKVRDQTFISTYT